MPSGSEEVIVRGIPISKGIGIGFPIFFASLEDQVPEVAIPKKEIDLEIDRYRRALDLSRKDVEMLQRLSLNEGPPEIVSILGTHLEMMQDPLLTNVIEDRIRDMERNTESIFHHIIEEYKERFGVDIRLRYKDELQRLAAAGLIEVDSRKIRISRNGKILANEVFAAFI